MDRTAPEEADGGGHGGQGGGGKEKSRPAHKSEAPYVVSVGDSARNGRAFPSNSIRTAKYTLWSFIPKSLFEQFRRFANIYFLAIAIIALTTDTVQPFTSILPLIFVLLVAMTKEAIEDYRRYVDDKKANSRCFDVVRDGKEQSVKSSNIKVGDIVHVRPAETFPADLVLLRSSQPTGSCRIETSNLDGESNLKERGSVAFSRNFTTDQLKQLVAEVHCGQPDTNLYHFEGSMKYRDANGEQISVPLESSHFLQRGATLDDTDTISACVVYAGVDTKLFRNLQVDASKTSQLQTKLDRTGMASFGLKGVLLIVATVYATVWQRDVGSVVWYLEGQDITAGEAGGLHFLSYFLLFSFLIPISLYVTLELVRFAQAIFMHVDEDMPGMVPKNSNANETLGLIQHLFSDKTGTITKNIMKLTKLSIGDRNYEMDSATARTCFDLARKESSDKLALVHEFFMAMAVCNTVVPVVPRPTDKMAVEDEHNKDKDANPNNNNNNSNSNSKVVSSSRTTTPTANATAVGVTGDDGGKDDRPDDSNTAVDGGVMHLHPDQQAELLITSLSGLSAEEKQQQHLQKQQQQQGTKAATGTTATATSTHDDAAAAGAPFAAVAAAVASGDAIRYKADSPDELALVSMGRDAGVVLMGRADEFNEKEGRVRRYVTVDVQHDSVGTLTHEILVTLEFNADRKRMSTIMRTPEGKLVMFMKGADNYVMARCRKEDPMMEAMQEQVVAYAKEGLRTLVFAKRDVTEDEFSDWFQRVQAAQNEISNREAKLGVLYEEMETDMELMGCSAVEDKLQDDVAETIHYLARCGILIWLLTGDKEETAINIGYSTKLLLPEHELLQFHIPDAQGGSDGNDAQQQPQQQQQQQQEQQQQQQQQQQQGQGGGVDAVAKRVAACGALLDEYLQKYDPGTSPKDFAFVIQGDALRVCLHQDNYERFVALTSRAAAVVCCRCTPIDKAMVVNVVKRELDKITLAVGDGSNDVAMIQEAHVGVGISGLEGTQAARASDFAIHEFKHLKPLIAVHGRYSYLRLTGVIQYSFYKNMAYILPQFLFGLYSGFSGQVYYNEWILSFFNMFFTFLPPLFYGIFEIDVTRAMIYKYPELYRYHQSDPLYTVSTCLKWAGTALMHAFLIFWMSFAVFSFGHIWNQGYFGGHWSMSSLSSHSAVAVVLLQHLLQMNNWNVLSIAAWLLSWLGYIILALLLSSTVSDGYYWTFVRVLDSGPLWFGYILIIFTCLAPALLYSSYRRAYYPTDWELVQEYERLVLPHQDDGNNTEDRQHASELGAMKAKGKQTEKENNDDFASIPPLMPKPSADNNNDGKSQDSVSIIEA